jgi:hypothetical protein
LKRRTNKKKREDVFERTKRSARLDGCGEVKEIEEKKGKVNLQLNVVNNLVRSNHWPADHGVEGEARNFISFVAAFDELDRNRKEKTCSKEKNKSTYPCPLIKNDYALVNRHREARWWMRSCPIADARSSESDSQTNDITAQNYSERIVQFV